VLEKGTGQLHAPIALPQPAFPQSGCPHVNFLKTDPSFENQKTTTNQNATNWAGDKYITFFHSAQQCEASISSKEHAHIYCHYPTKNIMHIKYKYHSFNGVLK
jgi:hypothetical protein